ncbi:MAG: hypothetical protein AAF497_07525 [Planctomycetota bacterium]
MKFRFRFESILRLRQQQKTQVEYELSRLANERNRIRSELDQIDSQLDQITLGNHASATTVVTQLVNAMQNSSRLMELRDEKLQRLDEATRNWKKTNKQFEALRMTIESLENLKQKQLDVFRVKESRRQQRHQDDDVLRRLQQNKA